MSFRRVCVFCGSSDGERPAFRAAAVAIAEALVKQGTELVYGGGSIGLMGALADAALERGGHVIGVIPEALWRWEVAHIGLQDLRVVDSMHARKALMADLSDAFIALPGGYGTLEELCEVLTWAQLGLHSKPIGLLNTEGYFDPLLALFDHGIAEGFIRPVHRELFLVDADPKSLMQRLQEYRPPQMPMKISEEER